VTRAAEETSTGAANSQQAAQALATMAADLQQLVAQFHHEAEAYSGQCDSSAAGPARGGLRPRIGDRRRPSAFAN
jgi:hypothetical protein